MDISRKRRFLYSIVVLLAAATLFEGGARLVWKPGKGTLYEEHRQIIDVLGLPGLNETMLFDPVLFWKLRPGLDSFRVQGRMKDRRVDFEVTTNSLGLRSPEVRERKRGFRVLAVGNSCTFGLGVDDSQTWPARLREEMSRTLGDGVEVINAGVPGYSSYQGLKYLEGAGFDLKPDLVIATFGFNDSDVWGSRTDAETGRLLRMGTVRSVLGKSRFYRLLTDLLRRSGAVAGGKTVEGDRRGKEPRVTPEEFEENLRAIHEVCAARGVPVIFLIWPYRNQVRKGDAQLIVYQPLIARVGSETGSPVISLIEPFIEAAEEPLLDHIHASPAGCAVVAKTIASLLEQARVR